MTYVVTPNLSVIHGLQCTVLHWTVTWRISLKVKRYEVQHTGSTPEI